MTDPELTKLVQRFRAVAPAEIARFFPSRNNCIAAVRIVEQVFLRLGVLVRPHPCRYICEAPALGKAYVAGPRDPEWDKRFAANVPVVLDLRSGEGWKGHLVALAGRWLIDPTWTAAGSFLDFDGGDDCLALNMPRDYVSEEEAIVIELGLSTGATLRLRYEPLEDRSYETSPAWELDHLEPAIGLILRRMAGRAPEVFSQFVVYRRPKDIPFASIVVRRWQLVDGEIVPDAKPCIVLAGPEELALQFARERLEAKGLMRWERFAHDDPAIVEVWF